jgi:hypothetical protein
MPVNGSGNQFAASHPIRNGLILWYDSRYVEPSIGGGTWDDISGSGANATEYNAEDADWKGYYWDLDGSNEYFRRTSISSMTDYTLEFWGDRDDTSGAEYYFDGRAADTTDNWWFLSEYSSQDTNFHNKSYKNWSNGYSNWHQAVATNQSGETHLYINGEWQDEGTSSGTWDSSTFSIGARYSNTAPWNGKIGIVRVYNRVLTAAECMHNFLVDAGKFKITIVGTS